MARKTSRQLKISDIVISPTAMQLLQLQGGEILVMRLIRKLQDEWPTYPRKAGMVNVLRVGLKDNQEVHCLFPLAGRRGIAIMTPEEAERSKKAILTGVPDEIALQRVRFA